MAVRPNHRPRILPAGSVDIKTTIPAEMDAAISALAKASGVSKYAFVRSLLVAGLAPFEITDPNLLAMIPPTPSSRLAS